VLQLPTLGGLTTRRTSGKYDTAGNALWHEGDLLVESVYRFKGQSAPAVVLCEVDFETLSPLEARKLFVGMTRGQMRVEVVLTERAAGQLAQRC
jgi:superfamily I DNA and RNA helicase